MTDSSHYPGTRRLARQLPAMLLAMLLSACGANLIPPPASPPAQYLLQVPAGDARFAAQGPSLMVNTIRSAAGFGSADMIYVTQAHQLQAFANHRWVDSPARMLDPILVTTAERSGLFSQVAGTSHQIRTTLELDTELLRMQQVFTDPGSHVELAIRAGLIEVASRRMLASQVFQVTVTAEPTPYGGVLAYNRAVELLSDELVAFLSRASTGQQ